MSRFIDVLNRGREILKESGISDFDTDNWILFEHIFNISRAQYLTYQFEENRDIKKEDKYYSLISRRCEKIPVQYITGHQEFMGLDFIVNEHTLIPRQDTEILVENVVNYIKKMEQKTVRVLDMCTGSGCIGISIGKFLPNTRVVGVDISKEALNVAVRNAELHKCNNIEFLCEDLFDGMDENAKFDIIVSNPPYIKTTEIEKLMDEVKLHEPIGALDGNQDGLYFYRKITKEAVIRLNENGQLFYEIGFDQGMEVTEILKENNFNMVEVIKDLAGLDRVVTGRLNH